MKNDTAETSPSPGTSSLSTILRGKNNVDLITSDKQLAKKKSMKNYQEDSLKCGFTSTIIHSKPCHRHILCLEILTNDHETNLCFMDK